MSEAPPIAPPARLGPLLKPVVAALVFLPVLELLPIWLILASRQSYSKSGVILGAILAVVCALPSLGIALGKPWGVGGARYIAFFGVLVAVMKFMGDRLTGPMDIARFAIFALAMAALGSEKIVYQPRDEEDDDRPASDDSPRWFKENFEALVVAFVMALIIRCFCLEVFMIPSNSMHPTLNGAESGGDRIMVTKFYNTLAPVERFDVMVFKFPLNQVKNYIKRVVGLPGEELFVKHGNIWFHKDGDPDPRFKIGRRPLRVQQAIWKDTLDGVDTLQDKHRFEQYWETASPRSGDAPASFSVEGRRLRVRADAGRSGTRFRFNRFGRDDDKVDLRIAGDLEILEAGKAPVYFSIDSEAGSYALSLVAGGESELSWTSGDITRKAALKVPPLTAGRTYHVELMVYDGTAIALIDGEIAAEIEFWATYDDVKAVRSGVQVAFGSEGTPYALSALRVGHDIHYEGRGHIPEGKKIHVAPGDYVVMGDNVNSSHDSRLWSEVTFKLKDGREIHCESPTELVENSHELARLEKDRKLASRPDHWVKADEYGIEHILYDKDLDDEKPRSPGKDFTFVNERFLVGKALWIWWPPARAGRLIR